jgi:hypothetical protein
MDKEQERDLTKLEGEAVADEFVPDTSEPEKLPRVSLASKQVAGYVVTGVTVVCSLMASKRGAHWVLSEKEQEDLLNATALVAQKYISIDLNNPLYALVGVCAAIAVPRLLIEFTQGENGGGDGDQPEHKMAE